jgi:hypothetical protein
MLLQERLKLKFLEKYNAHEKKSKYNIAEVAEYVVEVTNMTQGFPDELLHSHDGGRQEVTHLQRSL